MLSVWAILPAQVSLHSLVEVVGLLHNWIRSPSRPLNEDHLYTSLFASPYKFGGPDCILGPGLGPILVLVLGSIFGRRFGARDFVCNCRAQNGAQKWNPKQGPKYDPNQDPKMQSGAPNLDWDANKVYMIFIQRSAGRSDSIVQQTNNFNQRRKGNLGGQNCSNREHEYIHRPNVVKTCFTCRRYTVKSHAWENQQHACYCIYTYMYTMGIVHHGTSKSGRAGC